MIKSILMLSVLSLGIGKLSAQVTVYEHINYGGKSKSFGVGMHDITDTEFNDIVSSVKVQKDYKVTLYKDWRGTGPAVVLTADMPDLEKMSFNDMVSSVKVERIATSNTLNAGETLAAGQQLTSANGQFILSMQEEDGHLCVYRFENGQQGAFVWGSGAHGFKKAKLTLQTDGNLVVTEGNTAKWSSETNRNFANKPVKLVLEDGGSLKLYTASGSVVWTNTQGLVKTAGATPVKLPDYFKLHAYSVHGKRVEKGSDFYMGLTSGSLDGKIINPNTGTVIHIEQVTIDAAKGVVALKVINASQPDMFLSVADNKNVTIVKGASGNRHHFTIRTPEEKEAANLNYVSFESVAFPDWFLRHQGFVLKVTQATDNNRKDIVYRQDATWLFEAVSK